LLLLVALTLLAAPSARAQSLSATMTTSLVATQGETLTYTVVITNRTSNAITGVTFSDVLDPNTTLVGGSINTWPLAFPDSYSALGNVQITVAAPGVLANDVDLDGVGPALNVTAANTTSANGGNVAITANGGFTYNPPPGFEGTDTFTYTLNDGEGFTDVGTASLTVTGMVWFVQASAPAGGDGRLTGPFSALTGAASFDALAADDPGDSIFLYSGNYTGGLTLKNGQELIGQGAGATLAAIANVSPPAGSLALPATGGARPLLTASANNLVLARDNTVRGFNLSSSGNTALLGSSVGNLVVAEASVTNTSGTAVNLGNGAGRVTFTTVFASGGANGISLTNYTGPFTITGDGASAQNGTGGTIRNTTGNGIHLDGAQNVSLARMNVTNCAGNGIFGQNLNGFILDWCSLNGNGDATDECGLRLGNPVAAVNGLTGTAPAGANPTRIANSLIRASGEMNVAVFNNGGTLAQFDVTNVVCKDTRTRPLGADGFLFEVRGNGVATLHFTSCSFSNNFTQGIQASAFAQSVLSVTVTNCGFTNNNEGVVLANANDADLVFDLSGNRFFNNLAAGASGSAITVVNATTVTPSAIYSGKVRNNTISGGGIDNHLITALLAGAGNNTLHVANNNINVVNAQFSGIFVQAGETGSGNLNANVTVTGNTVSVGALGSHGIVVQSRITSALCAEIANNVSTTGGLGLFGINVRQRDTSTFRLPGFAGPFNSTAAVIAFLQGKNAGSTVGATVATAYSGGAACVLPLLAMPNESQRDSVLQPRVARNELPWVDVTKMTPTPTGLRPSITPGHNPVGVDSSSDVIPRVGAARQPWADGRNPVGIESGAVFQPLTSAALAPILSAARHRWADTGLDSEQLAVLDSLRFEVADLAGWYLGASSGRVVQLDLSATGYGWFIDPTPMEDEEFTLASPSAGVRSSLAAESSDSSSASENSSATTRPRASAPEGGRTPSTRIDLLSTVLHEMGHNLGLADDYSPAARDNVMYGFLTPGERRLPFRGQARDAVPDTSSETHYMFAPLNIGTLPAGKSITITFRVRVANSVPAGICIISNQGTVAANGGISVLTDDPRTPAPLDPTLTALRVRPIAVTLAATDITATSATLHGSIIPGGEPGGYLIIYRPSPNIGPFGGTVAGNGILPSGCAPIPVSGFVSGLEPGTLYNFNVVASNNLGFAFGSDVSFTTLPPSFLQQPDDALVCAGSTATFSVVMADSARGSFQWQRRAPGATAFVDIADGTNFTYTTPPVTLSDHGARFRVLFGISGVTITSEEAVLSVNRLSDPDVLYDFNSGLPPNTVLYGSAYVDAGTGVLELNPNAGGLTGAFLTADLAPGRFVRGFTATFRARLQEGSLPPADGFSFNWASDLPNGTYAVAEEGEGSGLRVCFDTWDNGFAEAPAIDVWWGPNLVARRSVSIPFLVRGPNFFDVHIRLSEDGLLDVTYACEPVFTRLPVTGYTPQMGARFGLGSRTGAAFETHGIDDLALELDTDPTSGVPRITSVAVQPPTGLFINGTGVPNHNYSIEASTDLVTWAWRATVVANAGGLWQFIEPGIIAPPHRFYRLVGAPQFPPGLVTWWRAEGNHLDSFGPHHGWAFGVAPDFAPGQRGAAFSFNGVNQAMFIGGADIPPPWTAAFWVNRQDALETSAALLTSPSFGLKLEQWPTTRQVGFTAFGVADYLFNYIAPANTWTHLTFVGTAGGTTLYVNGIEFQTIAAGISLPMNLLGGRDNNLDHLQGLLDETVLFNRALSPAEIQQVRNATRGP